MNALLACPHLKEIDYGDFAGEFPPGLLTQLMLKLEVLRVRGVSMKKEGRYRTVRLVVILKHENRIQRALYCIHEMHTIAYTTTFLDVFGSEFRSDAARELFQTANRLPSANVYFALCADYDSIDQLLIPYLPKIRNISIDGCMDCALSTTRDVRFFNDKALEMKFYREFATEFEELYVCFNEQVTSDSHFAFPQLPNIRVLFIQSAMRDLTWLASVLPYMEKMETCHACLT